MFILQFLPDSLLAAIIYGILGIGFVSTIISLVFINPLLRFLPGLSGTYRIIQLASVLLFLLGVYLWGSYSTEQTWRARVKEMEVRVKEVEQQAALATRSVSEKVKEQDVKIVERIKPVTQYIDKIITKEIVKEVPGPERVKVEKIIEYVEKCPVPPELIDLHNQAAQGGKK